MNKRLTFELFRVAFGVGFEVYLDKCGIAITLHILNAEFAVDYDWS